jgi:hypothetical protein
MYDRNYYDRSYSHEAPPEPVTIVNDELGEERFKKLIDQLDCFKLTAENTRARERIVSVFTFRLELAKQALFPNQFQDARTRLKQFKKPEYFLAALEDLILTVKKEAAAKAAIPKKPRATPSWYRY